MLKKKIISIISMTCIIPLIGFTGITGISKIDKPQMANVEVKVNSQRISDLRMIQPTTYLVEEEVEVEIASEVIVEEVIEDIEEVYYEPNYNPYNLLEPSNLTTEQVEIILEGTNLEYLARAYTYAEELYGINCLAIMSINIEESAWATSSLTYSNNNLGGIKDSNGNWAYFSSLGDCVDYLANMLRYEYLEEDGLFFNGYSIWDINIMYCETSSWSDNINQIAYELLNKL